MSLDLSVCTRKTALFAMKTRNIACVALTVLDIVELHQALYLAIRCVEQDVFVKILTYYEGKVVPDVFWNRNVHHVVRLAI